MEKRAIIAVGLSIAVFYLFSMLFAPEKQVATPPAPAQKASVANTSPAPGQSSPVIQTPVSNSIQTPTTNIEQKIVTVETDLYSADFLLAALVSRV